MVSAELIRSLEDFGLSNSESKVYLASLELGISKVNEIGKRAGIIRETTYGIINSLVSKGLISHVIKSGVKFFEAANPVKLKQILKEKNDAIENIFPALLDLKQYNLDKPGVELYEGKPGLKTVMEDLLTASKEIVTFCSTKNLREMFEFYFPNLVKIREDRGIKIRILSDDEPFSKKLIKGKILPKEFRMSTSIWIYDNKVAMISFSQKEPVGMIIKNKEIFETQKNLFELVWGLVG